MGMLLLIGGMASAALSTVNFDREIASGRVMVDLSGEVAVQFVPGTGYEDFLDLEANGEVSFDLTRGLNREKSGTGGFNSNALFFIGGVDRPVFQIVNHSDQAVSIGWSQAKGGLTLEGGQGTIGPGEAQGFYFGIDTSGVLMGTEIQGVLTVESDGTPGNGRSLQPESSFSVVSADIIQAIQGHYEAMGYHGRTWGDYRYLDIGLDPLDWEAPVGNLYYKPAGSLLRISPEEGYQIAVMDYQQEIRILKASLNYDIIYESLEDAWYFHSTVPENRIDITTLVISRQ